MTWVGWELARPLRHAAEALLEEALALPAHDLARPRQLRGGRREDLVDDRDLRRVDRGLPGEPEPLCALRFDAQSFEIYVKMHPDSVGQGIPEDKAIRDMMLTVGHRSPEWKTPPGTPWGQTTLDEWKNAIGLQGIGAKVPDASIFFTNDYIANINKFDQNAIKEQAKSYPVK